MRSEFRKEKETERKTRGRIPVKRAGLASRHVSGKLHRALEYVYIERMPGNSIAGPRGDNPDGSNNIF